MDNKIFRKQLWRNCISELIVVAVMGAAIIISGLPQLAQAAADMNENYRAQLIEMRWGGFCGGTAAAIVYLIYAVRLLRNPKKLEKKMLEHADERAKLVREKASYSTVMIMMHILLFALMITSSFSYEISIALYLALICLLLVFGATNVYYKWKY